MTIYIVEIYIKGTWVPVSPWYENHPSAHGDLERRHLAHTDEQYRVAMYERTAPRTT